LSSPYKSFLAINPIETQEWDVPFVPNTQVSNLVIALSDFFLTNRVVNSIKFAWSVSVLNVLDALLEPDLKRSSIATGFRGDVALNILSLQIPLSLLQNVKM
jgi:hypothetical protein